MITLQAASACWSSGHALIIKNPSCMERPSAFVGLYGVISVQGVPSAKEGNASSVVYFQEDFDDVFMPLRITEETDYEVVVRIPVSLDKARLLRSRSDNPVWPFINQKRTNLLRVISPNYWVQCDGYTEIPAFLNAGAYVGSLDLSFFDSSVPFNIEVMSAKINYEEEFKQIVSDVSEHHINLLYEIGSAARVMLSADTSTQPDLITSIFHLRKLMAKSELPAAIEMVLSSPISDLELEDLADGYSRVASKISPAYMSKKVSSTRFSKGGPLSRLFKGYSPESLVSKKKQETFDTNENRFIKSFLSELSELLYELQRACLLEKRTSLLGDINSWLEAVWEWQANHFWLNVRSIDTCISNSQRLQRLEGYRDVFRISNELREALKLPWTDIRQLYLPEAYGELKPIYKLYEYWCYFVVRSILISNYQLKADNSDSFIVSSRGELSVRILANSDDNHTEFEATINGSHVSIYLFYNRKFLPRNTPEWGEWSGSYSVQFDPDISVAVKVNGVTHWLNFDAKYRLNRQLWSPISSAVNKVSSKRDYIQDDLNKMHCYRDAILGSRGAYVLYPGVTEAPDELPFIRGKFPVKRGVEFPSVGCFSLRPGNNRKQVDFLSQFIVTSIENLSNLKGYQEETPVYS